MGRRRASPDDRLHEAIDRATKRKNGLLCRVALAMNAMYGKGGHALMVATTLLRCVCDLVLQVAGLMIAAELTQ